VSERLSLQRLLKINVVHSRPLVEKNGFAQCVGSDPLRQLPRYFFAVVALDLERSFEILNAILQFHCRSCIWQVSWSVDKA